VQVALINRSGSTLDGKPGVCGPVLPSLAAALQQPSGSRFDTPTPVDRQQAKRKTAPLISSRSSPRRRGAFFVHNVGSLAKLSSTSKKKHTTRATYSHAVRRRRYPKASSAAAVTICRGLTSKIWTVGKSAAYRRLKWLLSARRAAPDALGSALVPRWRRRPCGVHSRTAT
jgi:hypothetical protein